MTELAQLASAFLEGVVKVLPAILAAYYAYRLWHLKLLQDRADSVVKGCVILQHFCISLERHIADDPDRPNSVVIESINSNLDSILTTRTVSAKFGYLLETYHLWRKRVYFPLTRDNETDAAKRRASLQELSLDCERIVSTIRNSAPKDLVRLRVSSL